jgi:hypothetical protein
LFDLHNLTEAALTAVLPMFVKWGIVASGKLNSAEFGGKTAALLETLNFEAPKAQRFPIAPSVSFFIM